MPAALLMLCSTLLFATMGVAVKLASAHYSTGEIVFYRGLVGAVMMAVLARSRGVSLRTPVPGMHFWRSASGVCALTLWFYAIGNLPLATAVTLNYMSSVWMALFLIGGAVLMGATRVDGRLVLTVMVGFAGVVLILRPTIEQNQLWHGLTGLLSGMLSALAYLQVTALGRAGEPEVRVVLYFSIGGVLVGATLAAISGLHAHTLAGAGLLLAIGTLATVAQLLMTRAYAIGRPLVNASLQYLGIVFSFGYGVWLFDDPITGMALSGMALIICAGVGATVLRRKAAPQADAPTAES
ncbi:MAG: DMT family transporter [Burkholderiales bacterium]|nr:DMT family transporter [Burkholderiales bacterium]